MEYNVAQDVRDRSRELLDQESPGSVRSDIRPRDGEADGRFVVEHRVKGCRYAQFLQMLLAEMCCMPTQVFTSREPEQSASGDTWIIRQEAMNLDEMHTSHVCDRLFGEERESELVEDEKWESEVRAGIGEVYPGQFHITLAQGAHGREVIVLGLPSEKHARAAHQFLIVRFAEMHFGSHFDLKPLARMNPTCLMAGWGVCVREH